MAYWIWCATFWSIWLFPIYIYKARKILQRVGPEQFESIDTTNIFTTCSTIECWAEHEEHDTLGWVDGSQPCISSKPHMWKRSLQRPFVAKRVRRHAALCVEMRFMGTFLGNQNRTDKLNMKKPCLKSSWSDFIM